jgi:hypothetical protein
MQNLRTSLNKNIPLLVPERLNICIPLYNRGEDVLKLLFNIKDIWEKNKVFERPFEIKVIIGDFYSTDINFQEIKKCFPYELVIINLDGNFNISKSIQACTDSVTNPNDILMIIDADTVFEDGLNTFKHIINNVKQSESYYCPIVSTEAIPNKWPYTFNGKVYVPVSDHGGTGFVCVYNSDWIKSGGFNGSNYLLERGEFWGAHDDYMNVVLVKVALLKINREIVSNIWLRYHKRDVNKKWFSQQSSDYF